MDRFDRFLRVLVPEDVALVLSEMDDDSCAAALKKYIEENRAEVSVRLHEARERADVDAEVERLARMALPGEYQERGDVHA